MEKKELQVKNQNGGNYKLNIVKIILIL